MSEDNDQAWKYGLNKEQIQSHLQVDDMTVQVEQSESCLAEAKGKYPSRLPQQTNFEVKIQNASPLSGCQRVSHSSSKPQSSCTSPSSPSSVLSPHLLTAGGSTSPSLRLLNPGYVSSLAEFWAKKCRLENDCKASGQRDNEQGQRVDNTSEDDENGEVNRLKETIMIQCHLFRATEDENLKLKEKLESIELMNERILKDLNLKSENREKLVTNLKENLTKCNIKISTLIDQDLLQNSKIVELDEKLVNSEAEMDVLKGVNLGLEQELREVWVKLDVAKENNSKLEKGLIEYEEIVKDLRTRAVPVENIKSKMASLDQDVLFLRRKLQRSVRSISDTVKPTINSEDSVTLMKTLPYCTSTKKRRMSQAETNKCSPAKMMKIAETTFTNRHHHVDGSTVKDNCAKSSGGKSLSRISTPSDSSEKTKGKIGRNMQDCKQQ